jgi:hypothetical protein
LDPGSSFLWVSKLDGFNSSSRDDEAPLLELAVVLFFLVDILGFLLEPNTNGGRQLLCYSEGIHTNNEGKQRAQDHKHNLIPKEDQKISLNRVILKS